MHVEAMVESCHQDRNLLDSVLCTQVRAVLQIPSVCSRSPCLTHKMTRDSDSLFQGGQFPPQENLLMFFVCLTTMFLYERNYKDDRTDNKVHNRPLLWYYYFLVIKVHIPNESSEYFWNLYQRMKPFEGKMTTLNFVLLMLSLRFQILLSIGHLYLTFSSQT